MDAAPFPGAVTTALTTALTPKPPPAPPPPITSIVPDVAKAWPRCAQLAGTFLLGALAALLAVHAWTYLPDGAEPSELDEPRPISYRVDLNEANRAELMQLPGIGPNLADRIEEYRKANGGFSSIEELRKVKGFGPAVLERLRPYLTIKKPVKTTSTEATSPAAFTSGNKAANLKEPIDINHASLTELQKLPGIGPVLSQRIVDERDKCLFASVEELRRVPGIGPKTLEKIKPYLTVGEK